MFCGKVDDVILFQVVQFEGYLVVIIPLAMTKVDPAKQGSSAFHYRLQ